MISVDLSCGSDRHLPNINLSRRKTTTTKSPSPPSVIQGNVVEQEQMQGATAIKVGSRLARPSFPLRLRPPKTKTPPPNEPSIGSRGDDKVTNQPTSQPGRPPLLQHPKQPSINDQEHQQSTTEYSNTHHKEFSPIKSTTHRW